MKRTVYVGAGMLALSLAIAIAAQLRRQGTNTQTPANKPAAAAAPTTKIAIMNITHVVNNYEKFKAYKEDLKQAVEPFEKKDKELKAQGKTITDDLAKPGVTPEQRDAAAKKLKDLERLVEDNKLEAQKSVGKKQELQLYTLYADVWTVAGRVAQARGYDMILTFNEAEQKEVWSTQNIARKLQMGALFPIYYNPALDVSNDVLNTLNAYAKQPAKQ